MQRTEHIREKYYLRDCIRAMQSLIEIERFILSSRAKSICERKNIVTLKDLANTDLEQLRLDPDLKSIAGRNTINELKQLIHEHGGSKYAG